MKILKLLSKIFLPIYIIWFVFYVNSVNAQEQAIDIWNVEKKNQTNKDSDITSEITEEEPNIPDEVPAADDPKSRVKKIDLENVEKLKKFSFTEVVMSFEKLEETINERQKCLKKLFF